MNKTTALQRCDKKIKEARRHQRELQIFINAFEAETSPGDEMWQDLQDAKQECEKTKDYLKRMREWRRNSLSKLQRWSKEKEDRIKACEQDAPPVQRKEEERGVWDRRW